MKKKDISNMSVAELRAARDALKSTSPEWWNFHLEAKRKAEIQRKEDELKLSEIETKLSKNRAERANADLHSDAMEPLPSHHYINHEK